MESEYKRILLPLDLAHENSWRSSLPAAIDHARRYNAQLTIVTVVPNADIPAIANHLPLGLERRLRDDGLASLEKLIAERVPAGLAVQARVGQGRIYTEILRIAEEVDADLIIMASHRPGLADYLIGANAEKVMRHAQCSVLVIREKTGSFKS
ncbi:MAG: universal stress protein [Oceanospirillaceae bacterium]|nr:universal stress protein [Oceanospirillaceae bacterium]